MICKILRISVMVLTPLLAMHAYAAGSEVSVQGEYHIVSADLPPFTSSNSSAPGALGDVTDALLKEMGIKGVIEYFPWIRATKMAGTGPRTLILPLTRTAERESSYRWLVRLYTQQFVFIAFNDNPVNLTDIEGLKQLEILVLRGSPNVDQLKQRGFRYIREVTSVEQMTKMLASKRADLIYGGDAINGYFLERDGVPMSRLKMSAPLERGEVWLAGSLDIDESEAGKWQQAMQRIKANGTYKKLLSKQKLLVRN